MCELAWQRQKEYWLYCRVSAEELVECIFRYVEAVPDDHITILWLSSRGVKGYDNGGRITEEVALTYGNYVPRNEDHDGCCNPEREP